MYSILYYCLSEISEDCNVQITQVTMKPNILQKIANPKMKYR